MEKIVRKYPICNSLYTSSVDLLNPSILCGNQKIPIDG